MISLEGIILGLGTCCTKEIRLRNERREQEYANLTELRKKRWNRVSGSRRENVVHSKVQIAIDLCN